ncbi:DMT family transporter [Mycobacterium sp. Aquia_216]|uniref:DMT family transporter n=1 Tax=Mycobacterium sp. Aquia_216 TaxID=2991729 RepID=UPI00227BC400|nr:DMT family transporter [Mycobacterium sp. Aquia_216]WAJ47522.1 DMT family transporter [Mycobacterium sp. Aquia_216]
MPWTTASTVTLTYAIGFPIGAFAVASMSPMAVLVLRFASAAIILTALALVARSAWPRGAQFGHVIVAGLFIQAVQFCCVYEALLLGAPAVLCAVVIAMNPVATAILAAMFLREPIGLQRLTALVLGVVAVLAACARRLMGAHGIDPVIVLLVLGLLGLSAGGVYQQRYCVGVDFRAMGAVQNAVALIPAAALAMLTPFAVHDAVKAAFAVTAMVLLNATLAVSLYLRAISIHGAAAVAMLFAVIPAVAAVLCWLALGQRPDVGVAIGLLVGGLACWLNSRSAGKRRVAQHCPTPTAVPASPSLAACRQN